LFCIDRRFLVVAASDLEANGLPEDLFERRDVAVCGPDLELRIACRAQPGEIVVAARVEIQASQCLCVTAIQALGKADHR
jgi:hypothetical protein